jgi:hypothetical protein
MPGFEIQLNSRLEFHMWFFRSAIASCDPALGTSACDFGPATLENQPITACGDQAASVQKNWGSICCVRIKYSNCFRARKRPVFKDLMSIHLKSP